MLKIYSFISNRPEILIWQVKSFENHLKEPFEFHVVDNSENGYTIELGVHYHRVPGPRKPDTTSSCAAGMMWAWKNLIVKETGPVLLMHHDMFLIRDVRLTDYLKDNDMLFVPQNRLLVPIYAWEGFFMADMSKVPDRHDFDWNFGIVNGTLTDVGGMSYHWFHKHPETSILAIRPIHTEDDPNVDFHPSRYEYLHFGGEEAPTVLHYRAASDWMRLGPDYHRKKTLWLKRQLG